VCFDIILEQQELEEEVGGYVSTVSFKSFRNRTLPDFHWGRCLDQEEYHSLQVPEPESSPDPYHFSEFNLLEVSRLLVDSFYKEGRERLERCRMKKGLEDCKNEAAVVRTEKM
jgi:hypothetical protein